MSDGFIAFKGLGWAAAALVGVIAIVPSSPDSQWNLLRTRLETKKTAELQRPGLLKKRNVTTTTTGGGTTTTTPTTTTASPYPELTMIPSNFDVNSELVSDRSQGQCRR